MKRIVAALPLVWQQELKRLHYRRQIYRRTFVTSEPDYEILDSLIDAGSLIIDVGANVGHYTKRFSDLTGPKGRVMAFEPVPHTFAILAANVVLFELPNVSLFNVALSNVTSVVPMRISRFETGLNNWYEASLTTEPTGLDVMTLSLDSLKIAQPVRLVKIDAEGHEDQVLLGMRGVLERDRPILIVETDSSTARHFLESYGYRSRRLDGSPNLLFE